jgi:hypothetical protein
MDGPAKNELVLETAIIMDIINSNSANKWRIAAMLVVCLLLLDYSHAVIRSAAVYFSDGTVLTGRISLSRGRQIKFNVPKAGSLKTWDMVTGEDVQYGKVRKFGLNPVREVRFYPQREEMRRKWKFIEKTKYDAKTGVADYTPAKKEYSGKPYPVRYLASTIVFNSSEELSGHLYSLVLYMQTKEKTHKLVLRHKQRGKEGTTLDDLVYVSRIKMLDEGANIAARTIVKLVGIELGPEDALSAVTRKSLTPIETVVGEGKNTFVAESTFGEDFYLAARKGKEYIVGWPQESDSELLALADDHLQRQRDFYNDKQLLGAMRSKDGSEVLTLVNLRRRHADTNFGKIGGEWDKKTGGIVEPWRLSLWRWKHNPATKELMLIARGTYFRVIFLPSDPTPKVTVSEQLWNMHKYGETVVVGTMNK